MDYLSYDVYSIRKELNEIHGYSALTAKSSAIMASSLEQLQLVVKNGFTGMESELAGISHQLDDILDTLIDFKFTQFIQNEHRNQLLASIDATLKSPNKTAANELYEMGLSLAQKNKSDHAIKYLKEAVDLNPLHYRTYVQLALNLLKVGNYQEALHYAMESIDFAPENKEILAFSHAVAARAHEKVKDFEEAIQHIDRAINLDNKSDYTYEKARYYALSNNAERSMSELKKAIENNRRYFSLSLMDSAFHPHHRERERLLITLKEEMEKKFNNLIAQLDGIQFHEYPSTGLSEGELQFQKADELIKSVKHVFDKINDHRLREFSAIRYSYNSLLEGFHRYYNRLIQLYSKSQSLVKEQGNRKTYIGYCQSYDEYILFKKEFNESVTRMNEFTHSFKEKTDTAQQTFDSNLEIVQDFKKVISWELRQYRRSGSYLGLAISMFSGKRSIVGLYLGEEKMVEIRKEMDSVIGEAQKNVENADKHTIAIKQFVDEILTDRPLPHTL